MNWQMTFGHRDLGHLRVLVEFVVYLRVPAMPELENWRPFLGQEQKLDHGETRIARAGETMYDALG